MITLSNQQIGANWRHLGATQNTTCKNVAPLSFQHAISGRVETNPDPHSKFAEQVRNAGANKRRECGIVREVFMTRWRNLSGPLPLTSSGVSWDHAISFQGACQ